MRTLHNEVLNESAVFSKHLAKTFLWMILGLGISAATAWYVYDSYLWVDILSAFGGYGSIILLVAQLVLVVMLSQAVRKWSMPVAVAIFAAYAILTGVNLSVLPIVYDITSIYIALIFAAVMFGCMAIIGLTTKTDLTKFGPFFIAGLWTMILLMVAGLFLDLSVMEMAINYCVVGLFLGITAWDIQKIRLWHEEAVMMGDQAYLSKLTILGALELYLDFINIFLYVLRIMGRRNK